MTEQERQKIKAKLIEFGLWDVDEPGDPTTDIHDAGTLNDRLQAKLAKDVFLVPRTPPERSSWTREVVIFHTHRIYRLVTASNYIEAISLAALSLPEFLRRHPEYAADDRELAEAEIGGDTEAPISVASKKSPIKKRSSYGRAEIRRLRR